jgi:hypothetical protein
MAQAPSAQAAKTEASVAYVAHQLPNRTRINIPGHRRNGSALGAIAQRLREQPGVIAADVIELTGSIIIAHEVEPEVVFKCLKDLGLFDFADGENRARHRSSIHSDINLETVLFGALAALSLGQFVVARSSLSVVSLALATAGFAVSRDMASRSPKLQPPARPPADAAVATPSGA